MDDLAPLTSLVARRCFAEVAYFGAVWAARAQSAQAHLFAGIGCCGCVAPLAIAQRLLEGVAVADDKLGASPALSPATELPYEGFFHLIEAVRLDRAIQVPAELREVLDDVADDLAYVSRRELHRPPGLHRRHTLRAASLAAAVLLRRLTASERALPGAETHSLEASGAVIDQELGGSGGDAAFQRAVPRAG